MLKRMNQKFGVNEQVSLEDHQIEHLLHQLHQHQVFYLDQLFEMLKMYSIIIYFDITQLLKIFNLTEDDAES